MIPEEISTPESLKRLNDLVHEEKERELKRLREQVKAQEETISHMRDTYWTLSRRLKLFANDFCMDESYAGAVRWIVHESNSEWMSSSKRSDPSDSEIPF